MNKVMIIDDDELLLQGLSNYLSEKEYTVFGTADGPRGILMYKNEKPDLVLLDLGLPSMDGLEVLKQILAYDPEAKVIMISGYGSDSIIESALAIGAFAFYNKPFNINELQKSIEAALLFSK